MHTKSYDGLEIHFSGPDLHQNEIDSLMSFLHNQIEEIDSYSDKSLFFQNPQIFEGWLALVRAISKIETWEAAEDKTKWEDRTETYVAYLLTLRDYYYKYVHFGREYFDHLKKLLDFYGGWLEGECIGADGVETLLSDQYGDDVKKDIKGFSQYLTKLNIDSLQARSAIFSVLSDILEILVAVINRGGQKVVSLNPSIEDFTKAIDDDIREWTFSFGKSMFQEMKEDLNRHYKAHRTDHNTPELWSEMLDADEDALNKAKVQQLSECDDPKQDHWGEEMRKQMDENGRLMQQILSSCRSDELLDLRKAENMEPFIPLLTTDNLSMFYDIIVRRSIIQCEMFPELKSQHDEWLNKPEEQPEDEEEKQSGIGGEDDIPKVLSTGEAQPLWEKLREAGFIVPDGYALADGISNNQATYIADCFSGKLKIKNKWKLFQQLWNIENMAQMAGVWKQTGKIPPRADEIRQLLE